MAQNYNREYWQQLISKYSERTGELQHKQHELSIRTETLQNMIGNCNADKLALTAPPPPPPPVAPEPPEVPAPPEAPAPPPAPATHDNDDESSLYTKINLASLVEHQCKCAPEREQPIGFFQCLFRAIFGSKSPKKTTAEPQVEQAQVSAPSPPRAPTAVAATRTAVRERGSSASECMCCPPIRKLSESTDCICTKSSSSSSSSKSKESSSSSAVVSSNDNNKCDVISLKSEDLYMLQKLEGLLIEQKTLNKQIHELELKERVYKEYLKEVPMNENNQQLSICKCLERNTSFSGNNGKNNNNKEVCELKLENLMLKNELKDLKLEIRQYLERIEGPMQFKIESERYKCIKLEEQLEQQRKEFYEQQQLCKNEISTLNMQLMNTNTALYELTKANDDLSSSREQLELKVKQLEDDLIRQKLSDFETIKSLTEALDNQRTSDKRESCNLNEIAKELSRTLKEIGPCGECSRLPSDIKVTAEYIKELAVLVDNKLPKPPSERLQGVAETPLQLNEVAESDNLDEAATTTSGGTPMIIVEDTTTAEQTAVNSSGDNTNRNDDDIVVVMPENNIESQSSKSFNQVETVDIRLPTPPTQSPVIVQEQSKSKKKCQCSRNKRVSTNQPPTISEQPPTITEQPPTDNEQPPTDSEQPPTDSEQPPTNNEQPPTNNEQPVERPRSGKKCQCPRKQQARDRSPTVGEPAERAARKKCQCSRRQQARTTTDQPPADQPPADQPPAEQPPVDEATEQQAEPPTTSKKTCACPVMKQMENQLNDNAAAGEVVEIVPPQPTQVVSSSSSSSDKNENIPLNVDRQVEIIDEPANNNVHVIAVITRSGMLDVLTKGPEGHVQTTLRYNPSGNIEVITEILSNDNTNYQSVPQLQCIELNDISAGNAEQLIQQEVIETEQSEEAEKE